MTTALVDKVMVALELAVQQVPSNQDGWATPQQVDAFSSEAGYKPFNTYARLFDLVKEGRAESKALRDRVRQVTTVFRPVRGSAPGFGGALDLPRGGGYEPPGQDIPGKPPRGGQDDYPDKTPPGDEWVDPRYLAAGAAGAASGSAAGAAGAAGAAASGTVRGVISNIM